MKESDTEATPLDWQKIPQFITTLQNITRNSLPGQTFQARSMYVNEFIDCLAQIIHGIRGLAAFMQSIATAQSINNSKFIFCHAY